MKTRAGPPLLVGVDIGGTFTDVVARGVDDRLHVVKTPSTPDDPGRAVVTGLELLCDDLSLSIEAIQVLLHGTTVATNAILQRRGARTALLVTEGFRDVLAIARQARPRLFDFDSRRVDPLIERSLRFEIDERTLARGEIATPVDRAQVRRVVRRLREAGVEAIAITFLHSYANPQHEQQVRDQILEEWPDVHVSISSDVLPEYREYERASTTTVNAFVAPVMGRYLSNLEQTVRSRGSKATIRVMQSSGGLATLGRAAAYAASTLLSGVAAGAYGGARTADLAKRRLALTLDMGGTSCDLALGVDGRVSTTRTSYVGGLPVRLPSLDVHTIGAGGGSIAYLDRGGALRVGSRSAGALPGPACYGRGGTEPTVTDANVVLGRLTSNGLLGGTIALDQDLAREAVRKVAEPLGLSVEDAAEGIIRVVNAAMTRQMRVLTIERGIDPRECTLVAFGGCGPLHAADLGRDLDIKDVIIPAAPGVTSAVGLLLAEMRSDRVRTVLLELRAREDLDRAAQLLHAAFHMLEEEAAAALDGIGAAALSVRRQVEMRYLRQGHELRIDVAEDVIDHAGIVALQKRFHAAHEARFGYRHEGEPMLIATALISLAAGAPSIGLRFAEQGQGAAGEETALVRFDGRNQPTRILARHALPAAAELEGPLIITQFDSTTVVPPGASVHVDGFNNLIMRLRR